MFSKNRKKFILVSCRILFGVYMAGLVYLLFLDEGMGREYMTGAYHYNLVPFREITRFFVYRDTVGWSASFLNLVGNVLIFMPFGFLVPIFARKLRGFFRVVLVGFAESLAVEFVQLVTRTGSFDVDDIILNTLGVCLGFALYYVAERKLAVNRFEELLEQEKTDGNKQEKTLTTD